jgi:trigger factor
MKAELIDVSTCKKNLDIEIPQEVVAQEITQKAQEFARRARVPGFRPGKAPISVVKTRYRDEILSEVMQHLMPQYVSDGLRNENWTSISSGSNPLIMLPAITAFTVLRSIRPSTLTQGRPLGRVSAVEDSDVEALRSSRKTWPNCPGRRRTSIKADLSDISFRRH